MSNELHEANRRSWNEATRAHNQHKLDQGDVVSSGDGTLFPEEIALLGDVDGRSIVHLQCNAGQDSLSIANRGANVLGVDISDEAIDFARALSTESGVAAAFVRSDLYDWFDDTEDRFDVAFCSYGWLPWLSDLAAWGEGVAKVLRPGGRLVAVEFHPMAAVFDEGLRPKFDYFGKGPVVWKEGVGDYVGASGDGLWPWGFADTKGEFKNPHACHEFHWSIGQLLTVLVDAGLRVEHFAEYPYLNGCRYYDEMRELPGRRLIPPEGFPSIPLMFSLVASRPN